MLQSHYSSIGSLAPFGRIRGAISNGRNLPACDYRLQSLRGIAASHGSSRAYSPSIARFAVEDAATIPQMSNIALITAAMMVFQPNTAVVVFYVLSGYVLGASLRRRGIWPLPERMFEFAIRRLARMIPIPLAFDAGRRRLLLMERCAGFARHDRLVPSTISPRGGRQGARTQLVRR